MATTVTSKGQVTIPKPVRDHLGIVPGSQVEFRRIDNGSIVIEKADAPAPRSCRSRHVDRPDHGVTSWRLAQ